MVKVLISDKMSPSAAGVFRDRGIDVDFEPGMTPDELVARIANYHGLAVRSATKVTAKVLESAANLKVIGRAGIGVDNIDVAAATTGGIVVMNTPVGNAITTAEHAIAMIMALAREIPQANASTHAGRWEKSRFMGVELMGKTLGIIGCGNIGSITADRAHGLRMRVIAYDPYLSQEHAETLSVERVELDKLFRRSDFISLHTPLTDATRGIIDAGAISKMKKGVRIVNCARGGLIVEADLKAALEAGHVAAAGLDVFSEEPAKKNILFGMEQVVATPHLGAATTEAQEKVAVQVAEQMADYLVHGAIVNALNMPSMSAEEAPRLKPYMTLAEQLGSFAGPGHRDGDSGSDPRIRRSGRRAQHEAPYVRCLDGPAVPASRHREHGQCPGDRQGARDCGYRGPARGGRRLPDHDPPVGDHGDPDPRRRRHAICRRPTSHRRCQGHLDGCRTGTPHALHHQPGQARLHRRAGDDPR